MKPPKLRWRCRRCLLEDLDKIVVNAVCVVETVVDVRQSIVQQTAGDNENSEVALATVALAQVARFASSVRTTAHKEEVVMENKATVRDRQSCLVDVLTVDRAVDVRLHRRLRPSRNLENEPITTTHRQRRAFILMFGVERISSARRWDEQPLAVTRIVSSALCLKTKICHHSTLNHCRTSGTASLQSRTKTPMRSRDKEQTHPWSSEQPVAEAETSGDLETSSPWPLVLLHPPVAEIGLPDVSRMLIAHPERMILRCSARETPCQLRTL